MEHAPYRLDEGIWLEDLDEVIPWNAKLEDLRHFRSPEILDRATSIHLMWKEHVCFGFRCNVAACRIFGPPNPRAYHICLETFHFASLEWRGLSAWSVDETKQAFKFAYEQLRRALGEASFSYPPYGDRLLTRRGDGFVPSIFWELPELLVSLDATFPPHIADPTRYPFPLSDFPTASFHVSVTHEPPGYDKVKAEARAIREREGRGARVDFVAW
jgi:hypothetical protein